MIDQREPRDYDAAKLADGLIRHARPSAELGLAVTEFSQLGSKQARKLNNVRSDIIDDDERHPGPNAHQATARRR